MESSKIREKFINFFETRGHKKVPSASLVPENDSSVLFTTAGMQQFKPYYTGLGDPIQDFGSLNVASIQKCVRTSDIEEVGDESHLTFFEMLGNFSFGGYFKKEAIKYGYDFITKEMGLKIDYVSIFEGDQNIPEDTESAEIWKSIDPKIKIIKSGRKDNFWGPTGEEGPCGPTTEIYVDGIEVWNIVFNQYYQNKDKTLKILERFGVDTGMGLERLALVSQFPGKAGEKTVFDTDLFSKILKILPEEMPEKKKRILADHSRAIAFMISGGVRPSNKGAGYILRRLLRRILAQFDIEHIKLVMIDSVIPKYVGIYKELDGNLVWGIVEEESNQFITALNTGMKELNKFESLDSKGAFELYSTYGLPFDVMKDRFPDLDQGLFEEEFAKHQDVSRVGSEQKFKGGLANEKEETIRLHTAHHLLLSALQEVLGSDVKQKGSNINEERLRIDFSFERKLTPEEISRVEEIVNKNISSNLSVIRREMKKEEAEKIGAEMEFGAKYPEIVSVYFIEDSNGKVISKEFCGGPHVKNTSALGKFKIKKEEAVSSGVRRIKAVLE